MPDVTGQGLTPRGGDKMAYQEESFLGSGDLYIDVYDENGNSTGELDVGNAKELSINDP